MHAFHSNWTDPFKKKYHDKEYTIEDFELLTTIISALKWQEINGDIEMITDKLGAQYYDRLGLNDLWNSGISEALEEAHDEVDCSSFWAAGKLYALSMQHEPCVMLDTDFIIWEDVSSELEAHDVTVIHRENIDPAVYPDRSFFHMKDTYTFPNSWNWQQLPCNTAFTFMKDMAFKDYYVQEAMRFMRAAEGRDPLRYMVFAEQRLLAMCAEEKQMDLFAFSNTEALFHSGQRRFTHIWGHKQYLRNHPQARKAFCIRCINRIKRDYPDFYPKLLKIEVFKDYLSLIQ